MRRILALAAAACLLGVASADEGREAAPGRPPEVLAEQTSDEGIASVPAAEQEGVLLRRLEDLGARGGGRNGPAPAGEVWLSGMVTSTLGWMPPPYVPVPAGPREISAASSVSTCATASIRRSSASASRSCGRAIRRSTRPGS